MLSSSISRPAQRIVLSLLAVFFLASSALAQTWSPTRTPATAPSALVGFGGDAAIVGGDIVVTRTGVSALFPEPPMKPGSVHVFSQRGGLWQETATLSHGDAEPGDGFGRSVAASREIIAVGAHAKASSRGAVYLFARVGPEWQARSPLYVEDAADGDSLGWSVAMEGGSLLVGAPGHNEGRGAVYAFERDGDRFRAAGKLTGQVDEAYANFGTSVALNGGLALIGAPGTHAGKGMVYAFRKADNGTWTAAGDLHADLEGETEFEATKGYGGAIALSEHRAAISAPGDQRTSGHVFLYARDGGTLVRQATATSADSSGAQFGLAAGAFFGIRVALNGDEVWVGAPADGGLAGAVHLFRVTDGALPKIQTLQADGLSQGAQFGGRMAVRENVAVIISLGADLGHGRGYVFERAESGWAETGTVADQGSGLEPITGEDVPCADDIAGAFGCSEVDLLSFLPIDAVGGRRGVIVNDVWGWTDPLTDREYALLGRNDGTAFIDVTDANNPVYLGSLPGTKGATHGAWRDMKVYANHVFVVADGSGQHGMQIFDLTRLRQVASPPVQFEADALYADIGSAHNVVVNEYTGQAYLVGVNSGGETCGGGLHMVDVRDPKNPVFKGCFNDPNTGIGGRGYTHDAQCVIYHGPDEQYRGRELCFNANETAISISDVTDKSAPKALSSATYPNVGYAHQGWLTEDHKYFFFDDEGDEMQGVKGTRTIIWDVRDLEDPIILKEHTGTTDASDHNLYIKDNLMYQSNYVAGLRILDVSDPENPVEVGYFDTVPWGEDAPGFAGSWSNYPFFESGTILITSMREGLFLVKKSNPVSP